MIDLRIISGGQAGVDRAALDAALAAGVECGGWCPRGRKAEDGPIASHYPLTETASGDPAARTAANVMDGDGTLVLFNGPEGSSGNGTALTIRKARKAGRLLLIVDMAAGDGRDSQATRISDWITHNRISVLNVAGPRESECPGICQAALGLMTEIIRTLTRSRS